MSANSTLSQTLTLTLCRAFSNHTWPKEIPSRKQMKGIFVSRDLSHNRWQASWQAALKSSWAGGSRGLGRRGVRIFDFLRHGLNSVSLTSMILLQSTRKTEPLQNQLPHCFPHPWPAGLDLPWGIEGKGLAGWGRGGGRGSLPVGGDGAHEKGGGEGVQVDWSIWGPCREGRTRRGPPEEEGDDEGPNAAPAAASFVGRWHAHTEVLADIDHGRAVAEGKAYACSRVIMGRETELNITQGIVYSQYYTDIGIHFNLQHIGLYNCRAAIHTMQC